MVAFLLILACLVLILRSRDAVRDLEVYLITIGVGALLIGGILNPMMIIQARLEHFRLQALGTSIGFDNQLIFYQSKSILDVFEVLVSTGTHSSVVVGLLIGLFSIIFPLAKLIGGLALRSRHFKQDTKQWTRLAMQHLSKWSMADVFVVAIFMSFIGFEGLIDSQLAR